MRDRRLSGAARATVSRPQAGTHFVDASHARVTRPGPLLHPGYTGRARHGIVVKPGDVIVESSSSGHLLILAAARGQDDGTSAAEQLKVR